MGVLMNLFLIIGAIIMAFLTEGVWAEPSSKVAFTAEVLKTLSAGQTKKGEEIAQSCVGCHVLGGAAPLLDGQIGAYLFKQLKDYQDGSRMNELMTGLVRGLSDQDLADIAAYFSQLKAPSSTKSKVTEMAEVLVHRGDPRRILPPCVACHERDGRGQKIDVPAIRGQSAAYLHQTLKDYKSGQRHNDLLGRMRAISQELNEKEIKALAEYYGQ